jgi:hypothetical protein
MNLLTPDPAGVTALATEANPALIVTGSATRESEVM